MPRMRAAAISLALMLAGCEVVLVRLPLGEPHVVRYGEKIHLEGPLTLHFTAVKNESRCPNSPEIRCIWGGSATIELTATTERASQPLELSLGEPFGSTVNFDGFEIQLLSLEPYPTGEAPMGDAVDPNFYDAQVLVSRTRTTGA